MAVYRVADEMAERITGRKGGRWWGGGEVSEERTRKGIINNVDSLSWVLDVAVVDRYIYPAACRGVST